MSISTRIINLERQLTDIDRKLGKLQRHRETVVRDIGDLRKREEALVLSKQAPGNGVEEILDELGFKKSGVPLMPKPPSAGSSPVIGACGKHTFSSKSQCRRAIVNRLEKGSDTDRLIAYFCHTCHGWHMSSRDSRRDH